MSTKSLEQELREHEIRMKIRDEAYKESMAKLNDSIQQTKEEWGLLKAKKEPTYVDFELVKETTAIVSDYLDEVESYNAKANEIKNNYTGELLKKMETEHRATQPNAQSAISKIREYEARYNRHLDKVETNSLDSSKITPDYEWLTKPVVLTAEELIILHERNANNPIFCRALRDYYIKHKPDYSLELDLRDSVTATREVVSQLANDAKDLIVSKDRGLFATMDAFGYFENIDKQLKGEGLYEQPQIIQKEGEAAPDGSDVAIQKKEKAAPYDSGSVKGAIYGSLY